MWTAGQRDSGLPRKHIYLPHVQTAIYDSKVKLFLKQGISCQLGRGRTQLFDLNARIQQLTWSLIFYEKYSTSLSYLWFWPLLILGGFSNFCRYYTWSQTGKSTGYRPTLKPVIMATSFSGGGSRSTQKEPPTLDKRLVNCITCGCESSATFFVIYKAGHEPMPYRW
jgi:hypothetical protein